MNGHAPTNPQCPACGGYVTRPVQTSGGCLTVLVGWLAFGFGVTFAAGLGFGAAAWIAGAAVGLVAVMWMARRVAQDRAANVGRWECTACQHRWRPA